MLIELNVNITATQLLVVVVEVVRVELVPQLELTGGKPNWESVVLCIFAFVNQVR